MFGRQSAEGGAKLCGFDKKPCVQDKCQHWHHLLGNHPQSGQVLDRWDCSFNWTNILLIEGAQQSRQTGASVDKMRTELEVSMAKAVGAVAILTNLIGEASRAAAQQSPTSVKEISG
jgi:hypothetical protein